MEGFPAKILKFEVVVVWTAAGTCLTEAELLVAGVVGVEFFGGWICRFLACEIFSFKVDCWIFWGGWGVFNIS